MRWKASALLLLTAVGCCFISESTSAQVVKQEVDGIRNFSKIESTVACAGAITPRAIPEIKKMGYASIINLRLATLRRLAYEAADAGLLSPDTLSSPCSSAEDCDWPKLPWYPSRIYSSAKSTGSFLI